MISCKILLPLQLGILYSTFWITPSYTQTANVNSWNAVNRYCSATNETAACGDLQDACCGTITTRVGSGSPTVLTRCVSRHLVDDFNSSAVTYTSANVTTTVNYACLNTTRPSGY